MAKWALEQKGRKDASCLISQFYINLVYTQFWDRANAALDTVGEKRAGNLNELLRFWQRELCKKRKEKVLTHHASTAFSHWLFLLCSLFFTQRSADVRYAWNSSYLQYREIVPIPLLFSFLHAVLYALCTVGSKSSTLSLAFPSSHIYLWHSPTLYHIICAFLFVWYPPLHSPPGFPFITFFS